MNIMFPVFGNTEESYQSGVAESKNRLWEAHLEESSSSQWIYVADGDGKVLSGAHWEFHKESPFINGAPTLEAVWHPEGEGRDFASRTVNEIYGLRAKRLVRPYAQLDMMFTYPKERRKGYGGMLMKWGMDKAAEMGVEVAVESSDQGYRLYKKFGLRSIQKIAVDTAVDTLATLGRDFNPILAILSFGGCGNHVKESTKRARLCFHGRQRIDFLGISFAPQIDIWEIGSMWQIGNQ
ncbi:hypothetical protein OCU04_009437 [Sclerotinia nivalis]|uniref:N-acetyltransferase domain-containing protein n=1 Tax=Sclerotinia nivalis TaxID=352851 RepID=A0A9X0AF72_9HELO|nr:hypothetical protein OCU04_009437 [Sclerotinia nivalis]